jgi:7,8-dihydropterin-6-yl-methyl-4-(beta-D-ribofuranosyl)aminobenzene 5'-phosphate synthase
MGRYQDLAQTPALKDLTIKVLHDNYPYAQGLKTAWGFSALLIGPERTILFDTGSDGELLLENMARLKVEPAAVDTVVLSHVHADHTGGLTGFLSENPCVQVFLLSSFPQRFKDTVRRYGTTVVEIEQPQQICANVYTTGLVGRLIKEQALIVRTERGLVILTGCAHPGVTHMVDGAVDMFERDAVLLVMGGFHLEWATARKIEKIVAAFERHGVRYAAPTHCSGRNARKVFARHFNDRYIEIGAGKTVTLSGLR